MSLGVPELIVIVVGLGVGLVPVGVAVWALVTLREVQQSQRAMEARLEGIERRLRER